MRPIELMLEDSRFLQQEYQVYLAEKQKGFASVELGIESAQKMLNRLKNLFYEIDKCVAENHDDASQELIDAREQIDKNILELFPTAHPTRIIESDNTGEIHQAIFAEEHVKTLEDINEQFAYFKDLDKENLSVKDQKAMLHLWEKSKDIIRQIEYLASVRQRLNPEKNIRNKTLEDAKEQLMIVESWPTIAKEKEIRESIKSESGSTVSDRFVLSDQGIPLPLAPNSPLQNGLKIIAATPGQNPNFIVDSVNGFSIAKVTNPNSCAEMKTDPQKKDHIRNLDGMIQAYMAGRSPDEIGKPIFISGEDAESRAILIKLCQLHDYKFECDFDIKPISDPQFEKLVNEHFHSHYFEKKVADLNVMLDRKPASQDPLPMPPPSLVGPPANVQYAKNPEKNAVVHSNYQQVTSNAKSEYIELKLSDATQPRAITYGSLSPQSPIVYGKLAGENYGGLPKVKNYQGYVSTKGIEKQYGELKAEYAELILTSPTSELNENAVYVAMTPPPKDKNYLVLPQEDEKSDVEMVDVEESSQKKPIGYGEIPSEEEYAAIQNNIGFQGMMLERRKRIRSDSEIDIEDAQNSQDWPDDEDDKMEIDSDLNNQVNSTNKWETLAKESGVVLSSKALPIVDDSEKQTPRSAQELTKAVQDWVGKNGGVAENKVVEEDEPLRPEISDSPNKST